MTRQWLKIFVILLFSMGLATPVLGQGIENTRTNFLKILQKNPNYFGTLKVSEFKAVKAMQLNTKYEEIRCLGFFPEQDLLEAIVDVKLPYGYSGALCKPGSYEYIHFYVDWNKDGDFTDEGEDVGGTGVNVHDIPNKRYPCVDKSKPLSYALSQKIQSKKYPCKRPYLVKVRAILSWNLKPTAGDPDFKPVWGNVVETWIQIRPSVKQINIIKPVQLKKMYTGKDVTETRFDFVSINNEAIKVEKNPELMKKYKADKKFSSLVKNIELVQMQKGNISYEQLHCLGLNYDESKLMATLTVKRPYGYSGDLCSAGSLEYVAFWIYVKGTKPGFNPFCYWKYVGTAKVNVHDIKIIPSGGLQYAVYLPVDLSAYQALCGNPRVLKVRAVLSWSTPPDSNKPDAIPVWGNRLEAQIQLKPSQPVGPGEQKPFVWSLGNMAVESISGNPYSIASSPLGDGYANGVSIGGGYHAVDSPFGRTIKISGTITNAPNITTEADKLKYKVQYRKYNESVWHDITNTFRIWIRLDGVPSGYIDQVVDGGYYKFQKELELPVIREVEHDVLAQFSTPVPEGDGLYHIRLLLYKAGAPLVPGVPPNHIASEEIKIVVDNTPPDPVDVALDGGACQMYSVGGADITGTFKAKDKHFWYYNLYLLPYPGNITHTPVATTYPAVPGTGVAGTFTITTSTMKPCGYVINLRAWDRTIINNHMHGNRNHDSEGFCLIKK